jgi:autotransporter adhesin
MSWSVIAVGKKDAVAAKLATDFEKITYLSGPEAELKDAAAEIITKAVAAQGDKTAIKVSASGSAGQSYGPDSATQTLSIVIEPIFGFVE